MEIYQNAIRIYCLPDGAHCNADEEKRSPLDLDFCPIGYDVCDPDCRFYTEE